MTHSPSINTCFCPFRKRFWPGIALVLAWTMVSVLPLGAQPAVEQSARPIRLESREPVRVWETSDTKVFVSQGRAELRQGDYRIVAPHVVVWLDKSESQSAARVRVFARGTGRPGQQAAVPVHVVSGDRVVRLSVLYRHLTSQVGLAWDCSVDEVETTDELGSLYAEATALTQGREDFQRERLPGEVESPEPPRIRQILQADEIHFFTDEEKGLTTGVYMGNVSGSYRNVQISSDVAVLWIKQEQQRYEFYARGNVRLSRKPGSTVSLDDFELPGMGDFKSFRADEVYVNPARQRTRASRAELRMQMPEGAPDDIVVVRGKEVYTLDSKNLVLEQGSVTHCPFGDPHYQMVADRARIVRADPHLFMSAWDLGMETGREDDVLAELPFVSADLGERPGYFLRSVELGSSDKYGAYVRTRWRPTHLGLGADWIDGWDARLDYFGARGPGLGTELEYSFGGPEGDKHDGFLNAYYVHDSGDEDDTGRSVPKQNRGRFWWKHRAHWSERWRTDAEFYWLSDSGFLSEYFEDEFETLRPPESYLYTRYRRGQTWAGLTFKKQVNHFMTQLEERPSAELQLIGVPLGAFVYDASLDLGLYDLNVSDELVADDPPSLFRGHTEHRISLPFSWGAVNFDPFVRALATWASEGAKQGGSYSGSESRFGAGGGIRASMDWRRTYGVSSPDWELNRLRHVMTPYVEFQALGVSTGSEEFIQLGGRDPWPRQGHGQRPNTDRVDAIDDMAEARLGFRHRLQTKRRDHESGPWESVDWVDLDAALVLRSNDSVRVPEDDNFIDLDFVWNLLSWLRIYSEDNRISLQDGIDVVNLGLGVKLSRDTGFGVSYHHISEQSDNVNAHVRVDLSDRYALEVREQYEFDSQGQGQTTNLITRVALNRYFHKWVGRLIFTYDAGNQGDTGLMIGFSPMELAEFMPLEYSTVEE